MQSGVGAVHKLHLYCNFLTVFQNLLIDVVAYCLLRMLLFVLSDF